MARGVRRVTKPALSLPDAGPARAAPVPAPRGVRLSGNVAAAVQGGGE